MLPQGAHLLAKPAIPAMSPPIPAAADVSSGYTMPLPTNRQVLDGVPRQKRSEIRGPSGALKQKLVGIGLLVAVVF
jgi:hypothetical protein